MQVTSLAIPDVKLIAPRRHGDQRGWFSETWRRDQLAAQGIDVEFVQDNQSFSAAVGTLRGLHFQKAPRAQGKLVRVLSGAIYDVALDLRRSSATFGRHVGAELTAENGLQLWVPVGFAHGFVTTAPNTAVFYKVTDYYAPEQDAGLAWDDPALAIDWPLGGSAPTLSAKDRALPPLAMLGYAFD